MTRRKRYRPRPVGLPVMHPMRRELILPAYIALQTLHFGGESTLLPAIHTVTGLVAWMTQARDSDELAAARVALDAIHDRSVRVGSLRPSGLELESLRAAVAYCDRTMPLMRTDRLMRSMNDVLRVIDAAA